MAKPGALPKIGSMAGVWANARLVISTRLRDLRALSSCLQDPALVEQLHDMRIAARRLRYTLELFLDSVPSEFTEQVNTALNTCKELQELLGAIHDADVLMPQLVEQIHRELAPGLPKEHIAAPFGVHFINWEACTGLISTCRDIMVERDRAFQSINYAWREHCSAGVFAALAAAVGDDTDA